MLAMEKDIWCIAGLHELHGKPLKTRKDQCIRNSQSYGKEAVSPILFKLTQGYRIHRSGDWCLQHL